MCAFLRQREPDDNVGYSILIYRLTAEDIQKALFGLPVELDSPPVSGKDSNRTDKLHAYAPACHYLGTVLTACGRFDEAIAQFQKALEIEPDDAGVHNNLGLVLARRGQVDQAIAHYQKALEVKPDDAEAHNNLGIVLAGRGQVDQAIAHYRKALEIKPDYAEAHNTLGAALTGQGRVAEAMAHLRKALEIKPGYAEAHVNLGVALAKSERVEEAMAEYQKALEIDLNLAQAHNNLGFVLARRGRLDEARVHFQKALELKPDYANAHNNLRVAESQWEEIRRTLAQRRELLRARPDDVALLNETAWILATNPNASIRNGAEAIELADRAAQLSDRREPAVLGTLSAAYAEAGRFPEAVETARKALQLATEQGKQPLAESLKAKIPLYEAGTPYHEIPQAAASGPS